MIRHPGGTTTTLYLLWMGFAPDQITGCTMQVQDCSRQRMDGREWEGRGREKLEQCDKAIGASGSSRTKAPLALVISGPSRAV